MPGISINCSGVIPASFSTWVMPAASIFSIVLGPTPANAVNGVVGAVRAVICSSISRRFSSSLLMSMSQPISLLASRTFCPFFPIARESCESSTITSSFFVSGSIICTRVTFAGLSAFCANATVSSLYGMMSIFSPRSSRMIDCTRMPFMPTHAPTGSTSLSRLITATLERSPASHVDDQVRPFRALHNHRHQFAHARMILVVNRVALGLAHLLQDHLLRRLRRNPPKHIRRLHGKNLRPNFRGRILFLGLRQADLGFRVGNFLHHRQHRKHVYLARFRVEFPAQVLFRLVILARRHHHRVFNRRHHDFRLDVLLAAQHLNLLIKQIRHCSFLTLLLTSVL